MANQTLKFVIMVVGAGCSAALGSVCFTVLFSGLLVAVQIETLIQKGN